MFIEGQYDRIYKRVCHIPKDEYVSRFIDVKVAQNVGMKGIWKRDSQWGNIEADAIVDELSELPFVIEKW